MRIAAFTIEGRAGIPALWGGGGVSEPERGRVDGTGGYIPFLMAITQGEEFAFPVPETSRGSS